MRILVVEDSLEMLELLEAVLGSLGHRPVPASSVAAAARLLEGGGFDLILSDYTLRDGTAHALVGRGAPVVVLTGWSHLERGPFAAVLIKPSSVDEIRASIEGVRLAA